MRAQSKFRENIYVFPKTGYCTSLGVPILINYSIFFNVRMSQIHEKSLIAIWRHQHFDSVRVPLWDLQGHLEKFAIFFACSYRPSAHFLLKIGLLFKMSRLYVNSYWPKIWKSIYRHNKYRLQQDSVEVINCTPVPTTTSSPRVDLIKVVNQVRLYDRTGLASCDAN